MFKQIILPLLGVVLFIAFLGYYFQKSSFQGLPGPLNNEGAGSAQLSKTVYFGDKILTVSVAKTAEERNKGLSGVTSLPENTGMLFVFDSDNTVPSFWMKDMLIAIDIIWIDDGKIIRIDKNVKPPAPGTPDSKLTIYNPGKPIDYVIEVSGGYTDTNNIQVSDPVDLSKALYIQISDPVDF